MSRPEPPYDRLGVFKELSDVPDGRRLYNLAAAYEGRDTWGDYRATADLSDRMGEEWDRFGRRWKTHMDDRGRHHALATPDDVEAWSAELVDRFSIDRAYQHWNVIEGFYDWLLWHTEHRHTYNPYHLAVAESKSSTREIWTRKMEKANE